MFSTSSLDSLVALLVFLVSRSVIGSTTISLCQETDTIQDIQARCHPYQGVLCCLHNQGSIRVLDLHLQKRSQIKRLSAHIMRLQFLLTPFPLFLFPYLAHSPILLHLQSCSFFEHLYARTLHPLVCPPQKITSLILSSSSAEDSG